MTGICRFLVAVFSMVSPGLLYANAFKLIHQSDNHIILEFKLGPLTSEVITNDAGTFTRLSADSLRATGDIGGPETLAASRLLSIPINKTAKLSILKQNSKRVHLKYPLYPYQGSEVCSSSSQRTDTQYKPDLFLSFAKKNPAKLHAPSFLGPVKSTLLTVTPILFDDGYRAADVIDTLIVRIDFVTARVHEKPVVSAGVSTEDDLRFYQSLFINKTGLFSLPRQKRLSYDLILSHQMYQESIQELLKSKVAQGRSAVVKYFSDPTASEIKTFIAAQYAQTNPPKHTLIVGSISQIPSFHTQGYWSDYPYTLLDEGIFPDLSIGRLPAHNAAELKNMIAKIIAREKPGNPQEDILLASGAGSKQCTPDLEGLDANFFQNSQKNLKTTKLCSGIGQLGTPLAALQRSPNLVILDGKGEALGITDLPLNLKHLETLKNSHYPLVIDIACLNARWPSTGAQEVNFAEKILELQDGGAAGILASTYYSKGQDLLRHMLRAVFFDDTRTEAPYHQINDIGLMILFGKVRNLEQSSGSAEALAENSMFMYLGDPASTLFKTAN